MNNTLSRQIILSILGLAILIVAVVGVSYAVFVDENHNYVYLDSKENSVININNSLPIRDEIGVISDDYFDFCVFGNLDGKASIDYEISLKKIEDNENSLNDRAVKIYLEKIDANTITVLEPTNYVSYGIVSDTLVPADEMVLYTGNFKNKFNDNVTLHSCFRLRLWIDESTVIGTSPKVFKARVNVYSKSL